MAYTTEQLEELERLIASGESSAAYQDRRIGWRSLQDLIRLRDEMRRELGASSAPRFVQAVYEKGL